MQHVIICAHPSPKSFSCQLANFLVGNGRQNGWTVSIRDLYKMDFKAVLDPADLELLKDGQVPDDILAEQKIIQEADVVTIISPLWWAGFPAILKGYIDRVFSHGFAFKVTNGEVKGQLTGKKVVIFTSMGNSIADYESKGLIHAFNQIRRDEVFGFCDMEVIHQGYFGEVPNADEETLDRYLKQALAVYEVKM